MARLTKALRCNILYIKIEIIYLFSSLWWIRQIRRLSTEYILRVVYFPSPWLHLRWKFAAERIARAERLFVLSRPCIPRPCQIVLVICKSVYSSIYSSYCILRDQQASWRIQKVGAGAQVPTCISTFPLGLCLESWWAGWVRAEFKTPVWRTTEKSTFNCIYNLT